MSRRLIRLPEVLSISGISRSEVYRLAGMEPPEFPKPIPVGARASAWVVDEVEEWVRKRIAAREDFASARAAIAQRLVEARLAKRTAQKKRRRVGARSRVRQAAA